jgi:hypothetical protein
MESQCRSLGLHKSKRYPGAIVPYANLENVHPMSYGVLGAAVSHLRILADLEIPLPLLILEDDALATADYRNQIEIPDDTDAVYLGVSVGNPNTIIEKECEGFVRVRNMLSAHAILYLNDSIRKAMEQVIYELTFYHKKPFDLGMGFIQNKYKVLAPYKPFFIQSDLRESKNKWQKYTDVDLRNFLRN